MNSQLTDITVVMDRSGSMQSCRADAEGGFNSFVDEQKKLPGDALLTLVQFDTEYEFVHTAKPIKDVPKFTLVPRGWTALLDAVGRAIVETGERVGKMEEKDRPGLVVFVIVTDGQENSSKEYKKDKIKEMIELQQNTYKWQFTFLAANQDAFAEASDMGIKTAGAINFTTDRSKQAYAAASSNVARMRSSARAGASVVNQYTDDEKAAAVK